MASVGRQKGDQKPTRRIAAASTKARRSRTRIVAAWSCGSISERRYPA